jgi:hypothetical protein
MTIMLRGDAGGYNQQLGWTGRRGDRLHGLPAPGPGRALNDDERTQIGYWLQLDVHLKDARSQAEAICDGVGLSNANEREKRIRVAVVEAAGWTAARIVAVSGRSFRADPIGRMLAAATETHNGGGECLRY